MVARLHDIRGPESLSLLHGLEPWQKNICNFSEPVNPCSQLIMIEHYNIRFLKIFFRLDITITTIKGKLNFNC